MRRPRPRKPSAPSPAAGTAVRRLPGGWMLVGAAALATVVSSGCATTSGAGGRQPSRPPSASPRPAAATVGPAALAGTWYGHGRYMKISATGTGTVSYRIYVWCAEKPAPPCDQMQGNTISDGGRITFRLTTVVRTGGTVTGEGTLLSSSDPRLRTGPVTIRRTGDVVVTTFLPSAPFCDSAAPVGACGA